MKPFWKDVMLSCVMGLILPGMVLRVGVAMVDGVPEGTEPTVARITHEEPGRLISVLTDSGVADLELEDYLTGVVLAEMPASFHPEALKAQAVVARTYTMRANTGRSKHEGAVICTDSTCCQSYISPEGYLAAGGTQDAVDKVHAAVAATAELVLTYDGELIEATYFSCSGGQTEDAVAVWGTDVPYLKSVASPGEEDASHFSDTVILRADEFRAALFQDFVGTPDQWFGPVTYTAGGGVATMEICGQEYAGTELRMLLGLRSTAFTVETKGEEILFTTRGYGHRVGMSQYGADAMAESGNDYEAILAHYYRGTRLEKLDD